jgi:hypothetical protein
MEEKILIACGGVALRMNGWDSTKCLLPIPSNHQQEGLSETLIERLVRQLDMCGIQKSSITLILGYKASEVQKVIPWLSTITIKNPGCPESIMTGIRDALEQLPDLDRYTIIMGDTIWDPTVLFQVFWDWSTRPSGIAFFGNPPDHGEMYAMRIVSDAGNAYLRDILSRQPDLFTCYGTKFAYLKSKKQKQKVLPFNLCRINDFYRHMQTTIGSSIKKVQLTGVKDIDNDVQYHNVVRDIRKGVYALDMPDKL